RIRRRIFELFLKKIDGDFDIDALVKETEGFTGADIKLVVREAVLKALLDGRKKIFQEDLLNAVDGIKRRLKMRYDS
ncbi:MAG: ATP-binding protein, partial [Archaeoglobus sp.]|nr:ATP-binding protein [Archaeoglobus sp.]